MISALFVSTNGPYSNLEIIDAWDIKRDARKYNGPNKVIAHPPCERWGRYWGGGPMLHHTPKQKLLGDDGGCFSHALWSVRSFGGIVEHPEASHAWNWFGIKRPSRNGGWEKADNYGGLTCCVSQGNYGHKSQKLTWLYANGIQVSELKWGLTPNKKSIDTGYHSKSEAKKFRKIKKIQRLTVNERIETPIEFRNLLIEMVKK